MVSKESTYDKYQSDACYSRVACHNCTRLSEHNPYRLLRTFKENNAEIESVHINIKDKVVKTDYELSEGIKCDYNSHALTPINGVIEFEDFEGNIAEQTIYTEYCAKCNVYYVYVGDFELYSRRSIPLCLVLSRKSKKTLSSNDYSNLNFESLLHGYGYNVSSGMNNIVRQHILARLIDYKLMSSWQIINHLEYLIDMRERQITRDYSRAIEKWSLDIDFVKQYVLRDAPTAKVDTIYLRKYIKHGD